MIGKGGMGAKTLAGLAHSGAVYLHAIGGAAQVLASAIPRVEKVFMLEEFGVPEALWVIHVERFPVVVSMDSHGGSLHDEVEAASGGRLAELLGSQRLRQAERSIRNSEFGKPISISSAPLLHSLIAP